MSLRPFLLLAGAGVAAALVVLRAQSVPYPVINSFSPASGPVGTMVIIRGGALDRASSVRVGNKECSQFTVDNPGQITARIPEGAASGPIAVTTLGGRAVSVRSFTVLAS